MIRTLEDYITSDAMPNEYNAEHPFIATEIPLDDKRVIELFHEQKYWELNRRISTDVRSEVRGIPEFGTDFVIQMVQDTKPQTPSDLDPYFRSVPRDKCMAWKCTGACQIRDGNDFYRNLYP